jgi:hypothetical protein
MSERGQIAWRKTLPALGQGHVRHRHTFMSNRADFIIMTAVGVFATLQEFELISIAKRPDSSDTLRFAKWQKAQRFYRWGGPIIIVCGLTLWLFSQ